MARVRDYGYRAMQLTDQQLFERCRCEHERARHYGYTGQDGMCDRCYCPRFTRRTPEAIETEARLVNATLERVYDAMAPFIRKAA
jgi:hypothetical protein